MSEPEISVVMATANATDGVMRCLASLETQPLFPHTEVIVVDCSSDSTDQVIRKKFRNVRLLHYEGEVGLPEMLRDALRLARGRIVAVTDPHCVFSPDWLAQLRRAHESDFGVIGGAVENGHRNGVLGWACYFADYGAFMLPAERHPEPVLAGNNVSYKRGVLRENLDRLAEGYWKVFYHRDLEQRGQRFLFDPALLVYIQRNHSFAGFLGGYFEHGWFFAAKLSGRISRGARLARLAASPLLPPLHFYRRVRVTLGKRRFTAQLLGSLPLLAIFVTAWSAGEFMGYLCGPKRLPREAYR